MQKKVTTPIDQATSLTLGGASDHRDLSLSALRYYKVGAAGTEPNAYVQTLADDVARNGIRRRLIVRPVGDLFEVVCGLKRWKAAIIAGLKIVPVEVRQLTDGEAERLAFMDNCAELRD